MGTRYLSKTQKLEFGNPRPAIEHVKRKLDGKRVRFVLNRGDSARHCPPQKPTNAIQIDWLTDATIQVAAYDDCINLTVRAYDLPLLCLPMGRADFGKAVRTPPITIPEHQSKSNRTCRRFFLRA
jgi:hypothetical protein